VGTASRRYAGGGSLCPFGARAHQLLCRDRRYRPSGYAQHRRRRHVTGVGRARRSPPLLLPILQIRRLRSMRQRKKQEMRAGATVMRGNTPDGFAQQAHSPARGGVECCRASRPLVEGRFSPPRQVAATPTRASRSRMPDKMRMERGVHEGGSHIRVESLLPATTALVVAILPQYAPARQRTRCRHSGTLIWREGNTAADAAISREAGVPRAAHAYSARRHGAAREERYNSKTGQRHR